MRSRPSAPVDREQVTALHEVALSAELSCVWASQLSVALDAYAQEARAFFQAYAAGRDPDPVPMLVRFGAANELLDQVTDRFEVGAEAITALRFSLAASAPKLRPVQEDPEMSNLILLRPDGGSIEEPDKGE